MKKTRFFLPLLAFLLFAVGAYAQDKEQLYIQAVKANPNDSTAHFNLGVYYLKGQKFDQAIPEFQKCVQINSGDQQARELLENCQGIVAFSKGEYPSAIDHFQKVLSINPKNGDANRLLAKCQAKIYMDQKKYPEAEAALLRVVENDPNDPDAYQSLGVINFQNKSYKKAVEYWKKAIRVQKDARIYKYLGFSYYNLGDYNNAIDCYNKSIQLETSKDPKEQDKRSLDETYYDMAIAYNDNALYDKAAEAFGNAFKMNPGDSNAAVGQAQAIDAAVNAHMEKANGFLLNSQYSDAIAEWNIVLKYQPNNKQAQDFIADAKGKRDAEVEKHLAAGKSYAKKGKAVLAFGELNLAHKMDPDNAAVQDALKNLKGKTKDRAKSLIAEGDQFNKAGEYADAYISYKNASEYDPNNAKLKKLLKQLKSKQSSEVDKLMKKASFFVKKGDLKSALKSLQTAKQMGSPNPATNDDIADQLFRVQKDISVKVKELDAAGIELFEKGNKEKAQAKFAQVLKLKADDETANDYVKKMTGQQSQQKVDAEQVKTLYYDGVNLYINGKINEAIGKWQECLKQDPGNVNAQNNIKKAQAKLNSIAQLSHN